MKQADGYRNTADIRGFTLIEQVMVIAIVALLAGLATPSLHALLSRNEMRVAQTEYIGALQFARYTAAMRDTRTVFCPTQDGSRCSGEMEWSDGWLIGTDRDHDAQPDGAPLRVGQGYGRLVVQSSTGRRHVFFDPDGTAPGSNITLLMCPADAGQAPLRVVVSVAGRIRGAHATADQAATCADAA